VANTYTQVYIQIVFEVEWRQCLIDAQHKEEIRKYITGIVRNDGQKLIEINSMPDGRAETGNSSFGSGEGHQSKFIKVH